MDSTGVIQASIAVYPLLQTDLRGVHRAIAALEEAPVEILVGSMATTVVGESAAVFAALERAFTAARQTGATVMTVTVTDACPLPGTDG